MSSSGVIKQLFLFIALVLLQVLVLNRISLLGYATPFLYIYFIIKLPVTVNRNIVILLGFILGLSIDIFCNTMGLNAVATTFIAFMRLPIQKLFFGRDDFEHLNLNLSALGSTFVKYIVAMVLLHHIVLVLVETFSYSDIITTLLRIFLSAVLTFIFIFALEGLSLKTKNV
ncbi:rod shape-determining protein MreD [Viscerimonas tarda]